MWYCMICWLPYLTFFYTCWNVDFFVRIVFLTVYIRWLWRFDWRIYLIDEDMIWFNFLKNVFSCQIFSTLFLRYCWSQIIFGCCAAFRRQFDTSLPFHIFLLTTIQFIWWFNLKFVYPVLGNGRLKRNERWIWPKCWHFNDTSFYSWHQTLCGANCASVY